MKSEIKSPLPLTKHVCNLKAFTDPVFIQANFRTLPEGLEIALAAARSALKQGGQS